MKFENERGKEVTKSEITNLFRYETFLKEAILNNDVGRLALNNLREKTFKKIYVVPTAN